MIAIQARYTVVKLVPDGMLGDLIDRPACQVPEGMAAENVAAEENDVDHQHDGSETDTEASVEPERLYRVIYEENPDNIRKA